MKLGRFKWEGKREQFFLSLLFPWKAFSSNVCPYWICWWGPRWPCQGLSDNFRAFSSQPWRFIQLSRPLSCFSLLIHPGWYMFVRFSFNLLCYLSTFILFLTGTLQMLCWTHGIYKGLQFLNTSCEYADTLCSFILQAYFNCPATLSMATGLFPENYAAHPSKECPVLHIVGPLASSRRKKKFLCNYAFLSILIYSFRPLGFCSYFKPIS